MHKNKYILTKSNFMMNRAMFMSKVVNIEFPAKVAYKAFGGYRYKASYIKVMLGSV